MRAAEGEIWASGGGGWGCMVIVVVEGGEALLKVFGGVGGVGWLRHVALARSRDCCSWLPFGCVGMSGWACQRRGRATFSRQARLEKVKRSHE